MAEAKKTKKEAAGNGDSRQRNLDSALAQITKTYGEGSIMRLGSARAQNNIEAISTGALSLDLALGGEPRSAEFAPTQIGHRVSAPQHRIACLAGIPSEARRPGALSTRSPRRFRERTSVNSSHIRRNNCTTSH